MKKIYLSLVFILCAFSGFSLAQLKIGYVDSKTILDKLPDAQDARQKLDSFIRTWQNELTKLKSDLAAKKNDYERRKLIMTEETKKTMEADIAKMQDDINNYRDKKFGTRGELFQKQDELMKPIQNKVFNVIKEVAEEQDLDFVFDRSSDVTLLYAKDQYDITPLVIDKLKLN